MKLRGSFLKWMHFPHSFMHCTNVATEDIYKTMEQYLFLSRHDKWM